VPLDLWENVETKVELVETLRDSLAVWAAECGLTMPRFNLMGHSIGAWLCVEVMKRIPTGIVDATYLLFPTLGWIANTTNGYTMWVSTCDTLRDNT
jgi:hypothetical protein